MESADPINPQRVFWELSSRLPDNCILTCDSGSSANWYARDLKIRQGMMASLSGGLATMGPGVPYAIAAKFAHPDRMVIALVGDGAMQMNGMNELITVGKILAALEQPSSYCDGSQQPGPEPGDLGTAGDGGRSEIRGFSGCARFPLRAYAELIGLHGIRVDRPEEVGAAWDFALSADRPVVLEMLTRPERTAASATHHVQTGPSIRLGYS